MGLFDLFLQSMTELNTLKCTGVYEDCSVTDIFQKMDNASLDDMQDRRKLIVVFLLPNLKADNNFLRYSPSFHAKAYEVCVSMILEIDQKRFSREELVKPCE